MMPILLVSVGIFSEKAFAYYAPYFPFIPFIPYTESRVRYVDSNASVQELLNQAASAEALGDVRAAIDKYGDALRKDSGCIAAYMGRAHAKASNFDFGGAISDYERVIRLDPDNMDAKMSKAETYRLIRYDVAAITAYNKIINSDPKFADAFVGRGLANYNLKRISYTIADLEKAKELYFAQNNDKGYQYVMNLVNHIKKEHRLR